MPTDFNGQFIYGNAATLAARLRTTFAQIEDMYGFLSGLSDLDLKEAPGGGLSDDQVLVLKSTMTELHDLARKFYGEEGATDSGLTPLTLPHPYPAMVARLVGPRISA